MSTESRSHEVYSWRPEEDKLLPPLAIFNAPSTPETRIEKATIEAGFIASELFTSALQFAQENSMVATSPPDAQFLERQILVAAQLLYSLTQVGPGIIPCKEFESADYTASLRTAMEQGISTADASVYFLQDFNRYLKDHLSNRRTPETAFTSKGMAGILEAASATYITINHAPDLSDDERYNLKFHFDQLSRWGVHSLLAKKQYGFAGSLLNFLSDEDTQMSYVEEIANQIKEDVISSDLCEAGKLQKMRVIRRHFVQTISNPKARRLFEERVPDLDVLKPEAVARITALALNQRRVDEQKWEVLLSDGTTHTILTTTYETRSLGYMGEELWVQQDEVGIKHLDDKAYKCLDRAVDAAAGKVKKDYNIAFKEVRLVESNGSPQLCVVQRDIASEAISQESVRSVKVCEETYIVVERHLCEDFSAPTLQPWQINLFRPKSRSANAFMISGNSRTILGNEADQSLMLPQDDTGVSNPRWMIIPVTFYNIEIEKSSSEPQEKRNAGKFRLFPLFGRKPTAEILDTDQ